MYNILDEEIEETDNGMEKGSDLFSKNPSKPILILPLFISSPQGKFASVFLRNPEEHSLAARCAGDVFEAVSQKKSCPMKWG